MPGKKITAVKGAKMPIPGRWEAWNSLVSKIRLDVEALNKEDYLVTHRMGGQKLRFEELGDSSFKVTKIQIPSAYLTVTNRHPVLYSVARSAGSELFLGA
jgi:hypothetical protein